MMQKVVQIQDLSRDEFISLIGGLIDQSLDKYHHQELSRKLYKVAEAANILRCSDQKIYAMLKDGRLKGRQIGRDYLIPHYELFKEKDEVKSLTYQRPA